ncbi:MAG: helix-turn-helix domain-containing protein [Faecousia sp.]
MQYPKQYRISQAAKQLPETNDKGSDIAGRCGFQDMSYFTRAFRAQIVCVPSQYRKAANS